MINNSRNKKQLETLISNSLPEKTYPMPASIYDVLRLNQNIESKWNAVRRMWISIVINTVEYLKEQEKEQYLHTNSC